MKSKDEYILLVTSHRGVGDNAVVPDDRVIYASPVQ